MFNPTTKSSMRRLQRSLIVIGLLLLSIIFIQISLAQNAASLKGPFHLNLNSLNAPAVILPEPDLTGSIIVSETFDSNYSPVSDLTATGWHQVTGTDALIGYTWGRVITGPQTDSVWVGATSLNGEPTLNGGIDQYTNSMESLLIYGPLDLRGYGQAVMTATYHLDSQPGDYFGVAVSTDGVNFNAIASDSSADPSLSATHNGVYNLQAYARNYKTVWVAFYFVSNADDVNGLGAFVNDVVVRATPLSHVYVPYLAVNYPPTPTPPPVTVQAVHNYTFGVGATDDPQFVEWGGTYAQPCGTDCTRWGQAISTDGNPDGAVNLNLKTLNDIIAASPNVTATSNYTYNADIYVMQGKGSARFGLIFGASLTTFGRDENNYPYFDPNRNFYKFDLQFSDTNNTLVTDYRVLKCQNDITACTLIVQKTSLPSGLFHGISTWNKLTVVSNNGNLRGYLNGTQLFSITDTTFTGERKFGIFLQSKDLNSATNPLKIRFDNVQILKIP